MSEPVTIPMAHEAEQAVLGAMLIDPVACADALDELRLEHFSRASHAAIYGAIAALHDDGITADIITLVDRLKSSGDLDKVGGQTYILNLATNVPTAANMRYHIRLLNDKATRRDILATCHRVMREVESLPVEELALLMQSVDMASTAELVHIKDVVLELNAELEARYNRKQGELTGVPSGFADLDFLTDGFRPGEFIILGGRPGMGKSAFVGQMVEHVGQRMPVHVITLEMTDTQMVARMLADKGDIPSWKIRKAAFDREGFSRVHSVLSELRQLYITFGTASNRFEDISRSIRTAVMKGARFVVLDYLQLASGRKGAKNRESEISEISRELKSMAKRYGIPILAIASLNREVERRENKRPLLSDLRESGQIESDADMVMFLYREEAYCPGKADAKGKAELIVAKGRHTGVATVPLVWDADMVRFRNAEVRG